MQTVPWQRSLIGLPRQKLLAGLEDGGEKCVRAHSAQKRARRVLCQTPQRLRHTLTLVTDAH